MAFWRLSAPTAWHRAPSPLLTGEPCTQSCCQKSSHPIPLFSHHPFFVASADNLHHLALCSPESCCNPESCSFSPADVHGTEFPAILLIRFMDAAGPGRCAGSQPRYKRLLCSSLKQPPVWRKLEGVMSPQPRASGQSIMCLSQRFGQMASTNSSALPSSQTSTISKLAS